MSAIHDYRLRSSLMYNFFTMFSIRMRASKNRSQNLKTHEIHISGAEGIYEEAEILKIAKEYTERALNHPRGKPDNIVITIEKIKEKPKKVPLLPVTTLKCNSPDEAKKIITETLLNIGVSKKTVNNAFKVLTSKKTMRGASLITEKSGMSMEPDKARGIRISRLGIGKADEKILSKMLSKMGINITTVKEALILASKAASCSGVIAEVCVSDDPDYTTGYVSSKKLGYLRMPNIKNRGELHGGRVLFIKENANIKALINYLEKTPVLIYI
ncbi:MAG: 6-carboxyhexanoate--CoA ligase [Thermodesulfovibrionales bacterium]|nr:6-carboxyhexanoate--CoA ligase [Thermodesulfovibrionales bacterium]